MDLSNGLSCEAGSFSCCCCNPHRCFQSGALWLYFPVLELWVVGSVSLPSCSSRFICMQMWHHLIYQPPPCLVHQPLPHPLPSASGCIAASPLHLGCLSALLLTVWLNVSSLIPWLLDFHTAWFSGISGYYSFLNLLLSFQLCEEAKYICLWPHLLFFKVLVPALRIVQITQNVIHYLNWLLINCKQFGESNIQCSPSKNDWHVLIGYQLEFFNCMQRKLTLTHGNQRVLWYVIWSSKVWHKVWRNELGKRQEEDKQMQSTSKNHRKCPVVGRG